MKKAILISFIAGIALMFSSLAMAIEAPTWENPCATLDDSNVCFNWSDVEGAVKYSVDVVVHDVELDTGEIIDVEFSFGTSSRTDEGLMGDSDLCIPLTDFVYDTDGNPDIDTEPVQLSGDATVKVKALAPGKGNGRQNNPFSENQCAFELPQL